MKFTSDRRHLPMPISISILMKARRSVPATEGAAETCSAKKWPPSMRFVEITHNIKLALRRVLSYRALSAQDKQERVASHSVTDASDAITL